MNTEMLMNQLHTLEDELLKKTSIKTHDDFCVESFTKVINSMCKYCVNFKRPTCTPRIEAVVETNTLSITFDGHKCFIGADGQRLAKKINSASGILLLSKKIGDVNNEHK